MRRALLLALLAGCGQATARISTGGSSGAAAGSTGSSASASSGASAASSTGAAASSGAGSTGGASTTSGATTSAGATTSSGATTSAGATASGSTGTSGGSTGTTGTTGAPLGTDDWYEAGHDPGHSCASPEPLAPPLQLAWSWAISTLTTATSVVDAVTADGQVHLHVLGNGTPDHQATANNPQVESLDLASGQPTGNWSVTNDQEDGTTIAAGPDVVLVNADFCGGVSTGSHGTAYLCGPVDGLCQLGDSTGGLLVDRAGGRFFAYNVNQYHDPSQFPGYCIPPANVTAYDLGGGGVLWSGFIARYPLGLTAQFTYAAGRLFLLARFTPGTAVDGSSPPPDGLYGLDAATGATLWSQPYPSESWQGLSSDGAALYATVSDGSGNLTVRAFDVGSGAQTGNSPPLGQGFSGSAPGFTGQSLLVRAGDSLVALDRATLQVRWSQPVPGASSDFAIAEPSGLVYLLEGGVPTARQLADGALAWTGPAFPSQLGYPQSLLLARGRLLVVASGGIAAYAP